MARTWMLSLYLSLASLEYIGPYFVFKEHKVEFKEKEGKPNGYTFHLFTSMDVFLKCRVHLLLHVDQ